MAVLTAGVNFVRVHDNGESERTILYALRRVTAADTMDLSGDFNPPIRGALVGTTLAGSAVVATITGNTITIPAGPSADAGYLLVYGVHA